MGTVLQFYHLQIDVVILMDSTPPWSAFHCAGHLGALTAGKNIKVILFIPLSRSVHPDPSGRTTTTPAPRGSGAGMQLEPCVSAPALR